MSLLRSGMSWREKVKTLGADCHPRVVAVMSSLAVGDREGRILDVIDRLRIASEVDHLYDVCRGNLDDLTILLVLADAGAADLDAEKLLHAAMNYGQGINISTVLSRHAEIDACMARYYDGSS